MRRDVRPSVGTLYLWRSCLELSLSPRRYARRPTVIESVSYERAFQVSGLKYQIRKYSVFDMIFSRNKLPTTLLCCLLFAFVSFPGIVECAKKASSPAASTPPPAPAPVVQEPVIEEVTQKQLERILQDKDYVAVYWCKFVQQFRCSSL